MFQFPAMTAVVVTRLTRNAIDETFVLAQLGYPDLTLADWRSIALHQLNHPSPIGGILLARDTAQRLKGLLLCSLSICIAAKPSVQIERLISFDVSDPRSVADALVAEVLKLGSHQGCDSISLVRPLVSSATATAMVLASDAVVLCQMF
jgi:hypothetical protein